MAAVDGGCAGPRHQVHLVLLEQGAHLTRTHTTLTHDAGIYKSDRQLCRRQHALLHEPCNGCRQTPSVTPQQAAPFRCR